MLITSDHDAHDAHMSTRNTVCSMGQGQGAGTAAALCAKRNCGTRDVPYGVLRTALDKGGVSFEGAQESSPRNAADSSIGEAAAPCAKVAELQATDRTLNCLGGQAGGAADASETGRH